MRFVFLFQWFFLACLMSGCTLGGLHAEPVAVSAQKPSNVAAYVAVYQGDHAARGLTEKSFQVYEDGQAIDPGTTQQTLLPRDLVAAHHAVLLVDMSGELSDDEQKRLAEAAGRFVTRARKGQDVSVYAFDGGPRLRQVGSYPKGDQEVDAVSGLASYRPSDPSSNLHSAVVEAIKHLDTRLMSRAKPIRIGTLVVLARGPDLAGRVEEHDMATAVDDTSHHVMAVTLESAEVPVSSLDKDGAFTASSLSSVGLALDDAGRATAELLERYYLFAYCSPARAGVRQLRVEVTAVDAEGKEVSGSFDGEFDATGFSSGCNPKSPPRFVIPVKKEEPEDDAPPATPARGGSTGGSSPASEPPSNEIVPPPDKPGYAK